MQVVIQLPAFFQAGQLRRMQAAGLTSSQHRAVLNLVLENFEGAEEGSFFNLIASSAPEELLPLIRELALAPLPVSDESDLPRYAQGVVNGAMIKTLDREKSDLLAALRRAEANSSAEQGSAIQRQLVELEEERRSLMR
jgi:DNA primase